MSTKKKLFFRESLARFPVFIDYIIPYFLINNKLHYLHLNTHSSLLCSFGYHFFLYIVTFFFEKLPSACFTRSFIL